MAKQTSPPAHSQPQNTAQPAPLTQAAAAVLRTELRRIEQERANQAAHRADMLRKREELAREIDGTDTVLAELDGTADRYRRRLAEAGYPLQDTAVWPLPGQQQEQRGAWNGGEAPHTGLIAAVPPALTDNPPLGYCNNCGQPVWRNKHDELTHGIGSLCYPDDPNSPVATIGETTPERPS